MTVHINIIPIKHGTSRFAQRFLGKQQFKKVGNVTIYVLKLKTIGLWASQRPIDKIFDKNVASVEHHITGMEHKKTGKIIKYNCNCKYLNSWAKKEH